MNLLDRMSLNKMSYDTGGFTVQEILSSFSKKILEIIDLVNKNEEVCKNAEDLLTLLKDELLPEEVKKKIEEMERDGTLEKLINFDKYNELEEDIEDINLKLVDNDSVTNKIKNDKNIKYRENLTLYKNTFGTFSNASGSNIIVNNDEQNVEVCGITLENDNLLSSYTDRDGVAQYNSITSRPLEFRNVHSYSIDGCIVDSVDGFEVGMIIDTTHPVKYSGIITDIDDSNNKISVNNWYKVGDTSIGQIPTNDGDVIVNPLNKIWNLNTNLFIKANHPRTNGCVQELDVINEQTGNLVDGIDVISKGTGKCNVGFRVRVDKNKGTWARGFQVNKATIGVEASSTEIGMQSTNATAFSYLSNNSPVGYSHKAELNTKALQCMDLNSREQFSILNNGLMSCTRVRHKVISTKEELSPYCPVYLTRVTENDMIRPTSDMSGLIVKVVNITSGPINVNTHTKIYPVQSGESITLFTDGLTYFKIS